MSWVGGAGDEAERLARARVGHGGEQHVFRVGGGAPFDDPEVFVEQGAEALVGRPVRVERRRVERVEHQRSLLVSVCRRFVAGFASGLRAVVHAPVGRGGGQVATAEGRAACPRRACDWAR
jgi:hypothetical protein